MKKIFQNRVLAALSSLRLASVLLLIFAVSIGSATFLEARWGRTGAYALVYGARWFEIVLGLLTLNLLLSLLRHFPYRARHTGFFLLHLSMIIILVSAGLTRYFGYEGTMHIREGDSTDFLFSSETYVKASWQGDTKAFRVRLYKPGPQHVEHKVDFAGRTWTLGVSEYFPHYEEQWVPAPGGVAALSFGVRGGEGLQMKTLLEGEQQEVGTIPLRFVTGPLSEQAPTSTYGDVRVHVGGESCTFAVQPKAGPLGTCGGYTFAQAEFHPDYKVGVTDDDPDGPMLNPMVRLSVTTPDGTKGERLLFSMHPDFAMTHSGQDDQFAKLDLLYSVNASVNVARGDGGLVMRAPFPVTMTDMTGEVDPADYPAGAIIPLHESRLYANDASGFKFVPSDIELSVVQQPAASDNPNAPAAARVSIASGNDRADALVVKDGQPVTVDVGGQSIALDYGALIMPLTYSLTLEDFVLKTYPGSDNPASYESFLKLNDPANGVVDRPVHIYMNHPLNYAGSKHFQSSYDQDRHGTILSVNHDPGKWPTYLGYAMLTLGFLLILLRDTIWGRVDSKGQPEAPVAPSKPRRQAIHVGMALLIALPLLATGGVARAQDAQEQGGHVVLSDVARQEAQQLIVQDFQGRMKPLDTLAREMAMKVTKSTHFEGRDPMDMLLSFAVQPSYWWTRPVIAVRNPGVKKILGVDAAVKYVSASSLFDANGTYILQQQVEDAHRAPARERTKTQQKLITFDERLHMLYLSLQGETLRLYPVPGDPKHTWLGISDVADKLTPEQKTQYDDAFAALFGGMEDGDQAKIVEGIRKTAAIQKQYGADVLPSKLAVNSELRLNKLQPFVWATVPYLVGFAILIIVYFVGLMKYGVAQWSLKNPFYLIGMLCFMGGLALHAYGFVLRWIASGRAPLSNGHESLVFIALAVGIAGLIFELVSRSAAASALSSLLTAVVLGISMMGTFDPAIGPLVPVLASYWLNIHVTIITASYGFLGLSAFLGGLTLVLFMVEAGAKRDFTIPIARLDRLNVAVMTTGLGMLAIGTYLGGVWANESWGRYWGWDSKETWALVSVLVYAFVLHFRWIPSTRNPFVQAAGSFAAISSIVMTYFGVNYFLSGLHSYAAGDAAKVPAWVHIGFAIMLVTILVGYFAWRARPAGPNRIAGA